MSAYHSDRGQHPTLDSSQTVCDSDSSLRALVDSHRESIELSSHHEEEMANLDAGLEMEHIAEGTKVNRDQKVLEAWGDRTPDKSD